MSVARDCLASVTASFVRVGESVGQWSVIGYVNRRMTVARLTEAPLGSPNRSSWLVTDRAGRQASRFGDGMRGGQQPIILHARRDTRH